jgi:NhaP-type Na+/H+ or K+/H+ antiporter
MTAGEWSLFIGVLLITMVLAGTFLARLPLSTAMIYLGLGYALGPAGLGVIVADPFRHAGSLELMSEVAVLISIFAVGLKLGVPMLDRRWLLPLRLAFPTMAITVGLIALVGVWGLGLSWGAAVLLGGILAPTDPVLASGIQSESGSTPDRVRFSLAGEGALNDGSAFPFVLLGLGLMGLHPLGEGGWRWWAVDLLWATLGGVLIGAILGALIGKLVVYLRTRHQNAVGLDEFLSLGLIAISYGAAQLCLASGFLAVFAAGLALNRVREHPMAGTVSYHPVTRTPGPERASQWATHPHYASSAMNRAVRGFNEQLEKLAELAIVLIIGAMLPYVVHSLALWWFVPLLFFLIRPAAVLLGLAGRLNPGLQGAMIGWFGIRGIGSVFYLMYALHHGVTGALAEQLVSLTLVTVAVSIFAHGVSARPLMAWYALRKRRLQAP